MKILNKYSIITCLFLLISALYTFSFSAVTFANEQKQENVEIVSNDYFDDEDDYFDEDYDTAPVSDPLIWWNKPVHVFNDWLLLDILKPIHKGYVAVTPQKVRSGFANLRHNLASPIRFLNALLQGEFTQAGTELGRFLINFSVSFGLADVVPAEDALYYYEPKDLFFGRTLATWGVPQGPYFVMPFLGPSTIREGIGSIGDLAVDPVNYVVPTLVDIAGSGVLVFDNLDAQYNSYITLKESSFDFYIALRNAYLEQLKYKDKQLD